MKFFQLTTRSLSQFTLLALATLSVASIAGCSDSDDNGSKAGDDGGIDGGGDNVGGKSGSTVTRRGSLTWNGKTEGCSVDIMNYPSTGEYVVQCQTKGDGMGFKTVLVEVAFKDEASARTAGAFSIHEKFLLAPEEHPGPTFAKVKVLDEAKTFSAKKASTGTAVVSKEGAGNVLTLTDLQAFPSGEGMAGAISAAITF